MYYDVSTIAVSYRVISLLCESSGSFQVQSNLTHIMYLAKEEQREMAMAAFPLLSLRS
jgi:hypothetical protein